ncbi:uncharacterized protein LOC130698171 [Daphnia carinata]|uniref:uncharacterized protein LOC130698171 n=1 Tax=Daphnia carinata TaxID=120202 RepID=UPI00257C83B9|nr:uncharacterized protein LOC130698171 [Daphnia carinata]
MNRVGIFATLLLLLSTSIEANRRVTVIRMTTETTTSTTTISTNTVCFTLKTEGGVPITPCRRRRQHWIEEPLFLAPQDRIDEDLSQFIIEPKETFQVEPTLLPPAGFSNYGYTELNPGDYGSPDSLIKHSVQSSLFVPVNIEHQRLYLGPSLLLRRIWAYLANDLYRKDDTKRTVTFTRTKIATESEMSTKTNTIGISGCTPSPLPYDLCP